MRIRPSPVNALPLLAMIMAFFILIGPVHSQETGDQILKSGKNILDLKSAYYDKHEVFLIQEEVEKNFQQVLDAISKVNKDRMKKDLPLLPTGDTAMADIIHDLEIIYWKDLKNLTGYDHCQAENFDDTFLFGEEMIGFTPPVSKPENFHGPQSWQDHEKYEKPSSHFDDL